LIGCESLILTSIAVVCDWYRILLHQGSLGVDFWLISWYLSIVLFKDIVGTTIDLFEFGVGMAVKNFFTALTRSLMIVHINSLVLGVGIPLDAILSGLFLLFLTFEVILREMLGLAGNLMGVLGK